MSGKSHGAIILTEITEQLGENPVTVTYGPPQISHGLTRTRTPYQEINIYGEYKTGRDVKLAVFLTSNTRRNQTGSSVSLVSD
jgi:hypothetical protein